KEQASIIEQAKKEAAKKKKNKQTQRPKGKKQFSSNPGGSSNGGGSGDSGEVNDNDSAIFNWPTNGEISSGYGYRDLDGGDKHYGIDIAAPGGTPVYAARSEGRRVGKGS